MKSFAPFLFSDIRALNGQKAPTASELSLVFENSIGKLLTVKELAVVLRVSEKTVRDWVLKEKIPVLRINHCVRFEPLAISEWLTGRTNNHEC